MCRPPGCVPSAAEREASLAFPMDMVFSSKGVVVRVIGVDTYNDVELVSPSEA